VVLLTDSAIQRDLCIVVRASFLERNLSEPMFNDS
jgi:hypothetical protein